MCLLSSVKKCFHFSSTFFLILSLLPVSCSGSTPQKKNHVSSHPPVVRGKSPLDKATVSPIPSPQRDTLKGTSTAKGKTLPYTFIRLNQGVPSEKYTLIVFLHGAGERGIDNTSQLGVGLPNLVASLEKQGQRNLLIFAPQCPPNEQWVDTDWSALAHTMKKEAHWPLEIALSVIDSLLGKDETMDVKRKYITGLSMGGYGVWDMIQRRPQFFSAALPICGGGDKSLSPTLTHLPVWMFHGTNDKVVPVSRTKDMFSSIKNSIGSSPLKAKMTLFENKGHLIWNQVYDSPEVISWMLNQ